MDEYILTPLTRLLGGGWAVDLLAMIIVLLVILVFLSLNVMFLIWAERKVSARIQRRMGPMMTGPRKFAETSMFLGGWMQSPADAIKLLLKEDIIPFQADKFAFILAPVIVFAVSLAAYVVIPFAPGLSVADLDIGLLYIVAIPSLTVLSILMAGWASNSKYSLIGGLRSGVQMLSYEIPMLFALLGPMVMAGSLKMQDLVIAQQDMVWFVFPSLIGAVVYFICGVAETNRPPFDLPEAESELVAGFVTEYSGMKFAMFFLAEFSNAWLICAVFAAVFLGGWSIPFWVPPATLDLGFFTLPHFNVLAGLIAYFIKVYLMVFVIMWVRWTFPRLRPDHLMNFGWKFLLPASFLNLLICVIFVPVWPVVEGAVKALMGGGAP